jgi:biotin carboxylase
MNSQGIAGDRGPVVLVGYSAGVLAALSKFMPDSSLIFIDEPDIIRKRDARAATAGSVKLRAIIDWEYQHEQAADCFYHQHRQLRPAAVVPISEYSVPFAARLAERYGVVGAGYGAALLLRDKHLLREVTRAAGIANPESVEVSEPSDVAAFMAELGGPVVLKPANRQAAVGTKILHSPAEVEQAWAECTEQDEGVFVPDRPMPLHMLAERFVSGDEFSVEMMFQRGQPAFGAVTRKFLFAGPRPVEQGHLHPADIDAELTDRLLADTTAVLQAVGMDSGFVHCEWIVDGGQPYLVECAGRMAGDGIIELIEIAWQYDVVGQFYDLMQGLPLTLTPPTAPACAAAIWMAAAIGGEVESVDGVAEAEAGPGVHNTVTAPVGSRTHELRSSWDRVASATAEGPTPGEALSRAQHALSQITIKVRPSAPS